MGRIRGLASIALMALLPAESMAQTAAPAPCVAPGDAESVFAFFMPTAIHVLGEQCAKVMPQDTGFATMAQSLERQYQPGSDAAWPTAKVVMQAALDQPGKKSDATTVFKNLLHQDNPAVLRGTVISIMETKPISARACRIAGHILPALEPIPPKGITGLFAAILEAVIDDDQQSGKSFPVKMCPTPRTT